MSPPRIAIVGMACRYPDANSPAQLWENVLARRCAFRRIPEGRLGRAYHGDRDAPDLSYVTMAGVLRDWRFDRERFAVPGPLFRAVDHTHWLALETAADALADACAADGAGLDRDKVGVVLGNSLGGEFARAATLRLRWPFIADAAAGAMRDAGVAPEQADAVLARMRDRVKQPFAEPGDDTLAGAMANTIAGRICNHFDFHGTGYTVDGACSSSLLAVLTACQALVTGDCDFMLAGGVDMSLDPFELVGFSRLGALASTEMRVYDAHPTGFLPGEGCGVVALMRADDAARQGRRAYAHIVGWASSSDGAGGLTRPEIAGQVLALRRAYRRAGVAPGSVRLIEGHGTGTAVGDRVELRALTTVYSDSPQATSIGSVKANIGHTKAAAAVAGLIKAVAAVDARTVPPTTGCERPHELLRAAGSPLRVLSGPEEWTDPVPRAGVSAMGFGGINAHIVVEAAASERPAALGVAARPWTDRAGREEIVLVGAPTSTELAGRLTDLAELAPQLSLAEVRDVALTAWRDGAGAAAFRAALIATKPDDLAAAAGSAVRAVDGWDGRVVVHEQDGFVLAANRICRVGLLFPGQAAPVRPELSWWADGLPVPPLPDDFVAAAGDPDTAAAQPAIVRQSLAGLAWLRSLGCEPVASLGHSLGEITALHWAGALTAEATMNLAAERGRIMAEHGDPRSGMVSVACSAATAATLIEGTGCVVAGFNAPEQTVVAGPTECLDAVLERAATAAIPAATLPVSHGFHSAAMRQAQRPLRQVLRTVAFTRPRRPVLSTVTGRLLDADDLSELLVTQLIEPVRCSDAITALAGRCDLLLEIGPGTVLANLARANRLVIPVVSMDCGGEARRHALVTAAIGATGAGELRQWFTGRPFRPLRTGAPLRFVTNPCEQPISTPGEATPDTGVDGARPTDEPLAAITTRLAKQLELPASSINADSSLIGDLHLTSLQVVQTAAEVATYLGRQPPSEPVSLGDVTVAGLADILAALPVMSATELDTPVVGVRPWVRHFTRHWRPARPAATPEPRWIVRAPIGHWLHDLPSRDRTTVGMTTLLGRDADPPEISHALNEIAATAPAHLLVVHYGHPAAGGLARSVAAELDCSSVTVLDVPDESIRVDIAALGCPDRVRYQELRATGHGEVERACLRPRSLATGAIVPIGRGDVCLVTGGALGISAHCAAAIAESTGCTLLLAGRKPADQPQVARALHNLRGHVDVHYRQCDVTDADAVRELLECSWRLGEVRGLLHGAGVNEPRALASITADTFGRTLRPKVDGLRTVLDSVGAGLRLVVAFGSLIGRQGLAGQAEYCVANDWMRTMLERWAAEHPHCRTHVLEWSAWSGLGMATALDVLDSLRRNGLVPISPEQGTDALRAFLADPDAPVTVTIAGRVPVTPTLLLEDVPDRFARFTEIDRALVPGVEAVADAHLSVGSDPYLADHRVAGVPVLPAVVGLEALAQVAARTGWTAPWSFTNVRFNSPVTAPAHTGRTVRLAALTDGGAVELALRDDSDQFRTDRFTSHLEPAPPEPAAREPAQPPPPVEQARHSFYDTAMLFHGHRFQRLLAYQSLSAFHVEAWIRADESASWFSEFYGNEMVLGDPGAHDCSLHVLLACVPHRRALPVGAERFTVWRPPAGLLLVRANEIAHTYDSFVFDVNVVDTAGRAVASWRRLRLRAVDTVRWDTLPRALVGPWLSRRLVETGVSDAVELRTSDVGLVAAEDACVGADWQELPTLRSEEDSPVAGARVGCARRALAALGHAPPTRLDLGAVAVDGFAVGHAGGARVATAAVRLRETGRVAVAAIAVGVSRT